MHESGKTQHFDWLAEEHNPDAVILLSYVYNVSTPSDFESFTANMQIRILADTGPLRAVPSSLPLLSLSQDTMESFYNTPPVGKRGTSSYLTKAVMIQLLQGDVKPCKDEPCSVS